MEQITDEHNNPIAEQNPPAEEASSEIQDAIAATPDIEEIDAVAPALKSSKPTSRVADKKDEPPANPLLLDPYEWDQCTITVVYALLPNQTVSVSIHNHKDEPIVKTFATTEVPLPEKISGVMATLQAIWPASMVTATVVLMPRPADAMERTIVVSVRAGNDTPLVQTGVESSLPFPHRIIAMLDELKALLPTRALKRMEKDAKTKISSATKTVAKTTSQAVKKPTMVAPVAVNKTQLSLF